MQQNGPLFILLNHHYCDAGVAKPLPLGGPTLKLNGGTRAKANVFVLLLPLHCIVAMKNGFRSLLN